MNIVDAGRWFYDLLGTVLIVPDRNLSGLGYSCYVGFNAFEATVWVALGLFVAVRFLRNRRSGYEVLYSLSFFAFGISDVMEIYRTTLGLVAAKGILLISILACRRIVLGFYPGWKC
jgi:hypothetical protein